MTLRIMMALTLVCITLGGLTSAQTSDSIPVGAPLMTDTAGKTGNTAFDSVYRVICPSQNSVGSSFLHKSGKVITAEHVVRDCKAADLILLSPSAQRISVTSFEVDADLDLALLTLTSTVEKPALQLSSKSESLVGIQVITWGFPAGYRGFPPLLSSGYLAGVDTLKTSSGKMVKRIVVNAAFNGGNSGGPVVDVEDSTVIGVVSSKLAPLPPEIESALKALQSQASGLTYEGTRADGTKLTFSEGQVVAAVLQYLRSQTQLVIGYAVPVKDLREFLTQKGVSP